jgi:hypothetical protein
MVARSRTKKSKAEAHHPDELTPEEERALQEHEAQKYLGISADEFVRRWHAGEYDGVDDSRVLGLAMLFHFA